MVRMELPINTDVTELLPIKPFRRLLLLTIAGFAAIWLIDAQSAIIVPFDAFSYPICMVILLAILALSYSSCSRRPLQFCAYLLIAGYLIASSIVHHQMHPHQELSSAVQWLALNYVMAYLFFERRQAVCMALAVLTLCVIGHFIVLIRYDSLANTLGMVLNLAVGHLIYIIVLASVVKIRENAAQLRDQAQILAEQASLDNLTGLLNRRGFEQAIASRSSTQGTDLAMMVIDIDHFKAFNDQYGHLAGDQVLRTVAVTLSQQLRQDDILARWGGEEFALVITGLTVAAVDALAERLRAVISAIELPFEQRVSISIGVAYLAEVTELEQLFKLADNRLYLAKKTGRNRVCSMSTSSCL